MHFFLKFLKKKKKTAANSLYWFAAKHQTSASRWQKFDMFNQNLLQNLMNFVYVLKATGNSKKWLKLKQSRKPHICGNRCLRVNSQVNNLQLVSKEGSLVMFFILSHFLIQKDCQKKCFSK